MRIIAAIIFFLLAAGGLVLAIRDNMTLGLAASPAAAGPLATSGAYVGTLTYERNNVGIEAPYVVYQDGGAKTKALVFGSGSTCVTSSGTYPCALIADALSDYYPGKVRAEGVLDADDLVVSKLAAS